jgi:hypothetical protein
MRCLAETLKFDEDDLAIYKKAFKKNVRIASTSPSLHGVL